MECNKKESRAYYTKLGGSYYRLMENDNKTMTIFDVPGTHSFMSVDTAMGTVESTVYINPLCKNELATNKEAYQKMLQELKDNKVTEIPYINNRFMLYVDYSAYDANGTEVIHNVVTKEVQGVNTFYPLGVSTESELLYKEILTIKDSMEFTVKTAYPMGIMKSCSKDTYKIQINDISVYQDYIHGSSYEDKHYSCCENCYAYGSYTISSMLDGMAKIYSTNDEGLLISAAEVPFTPRKVTIHFTIALDNLIVAYNDKEVIRIIMENMINEKYPESEHSCCHPHAPNEIYPKADGDFTPDENGRYDYYQIVSRQTEGSLVVVDDDFPCKEYDPNDMIHISMVIADIPNIKVGQCVKYYQVASYTK